MTTKFTFLILAGLVLAGCGLKRSLIDDFHYNDAFFTDVAMDSMLVVDERSGVTSRDLKVPAIAAPGRKDSAVTELKDEHKVLIKEEALKHISNTGKRYDFTVYVTKGEKDFVSSWSGQKASVRFAAKVKMVSGPKTQQGSGEAAFEVASPGGSTEYLEKLYQKAIRECIHQCFLSLKEL